MSAFTQGLQFGFAQGMFNNMFGFGGFGRFWGNPFGCCCMPSLFNMFPTFMVPRFNFTNLYTYPTIMPQVNLPVQTYNMSSLDFSAPKIQMFNNIQVQTPVIGTQNYTAIGDTFTKEKTREKEETTDKTTGKVTVENAKHWTQMTDAEMREIYGNYDRDITDLCDGSTAELTNKLNEFIEKNLKSDSVLQGKGQAFADAQRKYGISASVLLGICILESAGGTSNLAKTKKNVSSLTTGKSGDDRWRKFKTVEECIEETAKLLKNHYVTNSGVSGKSLSKLYEINAKYCPVAEVTSNSGWAKGVESWTKKIESALA